MTFVSENESRTRGLERGHINSELFNLSIRSNCLGEANLALAAHVARFMGNFPLAAHIIVY